MNQDEILKLQIKQPRSNKLSSQLVGLYNTFRNVQPDQQVIFDLSSISWVSPLSILPIGTHAQETNSECLPASSSSVNNYLSTIQFPHGIDTVNEMQQLKTYIPIGVLKRQSGANREKLETTFLHLLMNIIGNIPGSKSAIYYPISETTTNIFDHSQSDTGWILAQWYPKKKFIDLCIVDRGRGLTTAYHDELELNQTDEESIKQALRGISTKKEKERGFGIRTSKNVICKALKGSFTFISGSAAFLAEQEDERIVSLPEFNWPGVIIAYRIPQPSGPIDITPYLE